MQFRVLHVDDDPLGRRNVSICLGVDPAFAVRSCPSGEIAVEAAADWAPDLILLAASTPERDETAIFARLRQYPGTAAIPIVVLTARARTDELQHYKSVGAADVIVQPIDAVALADLLRCRLHLVSLEKANGEFARRLRSDSATLARYRECLRIDSESPQLLEALQACSHKLAGAAGVFGFPAISCAASKLEDSAIDVRAGRGTQGKLEVDLDELLVCIGPG